VFLRRAVGGLLVISTVVPGMGYVAGFVRDSRPVTTRLLAAEVLEAKLAEGYQVLFVPADAAPYILPPVDLFSWEIRVCRDRRIEGVPDRPTVTLRPLHHPTYRIPDHPEHPHESIPHDTLLHDFAPIGFADKAFAIQTLNTGLLRKDAP
jgi:hypothetical protein